MPVSRRRTDDPGTHIAIGYVDSTIKYSDRLIGSMPMLRCGKIAAFQQGVVP